MYKKFIATLLVLLMILSFTTIAFATSDDLEMLPNVKYPIGDVDMDEKILIKDATLLQKHLAKLVTLSQQQILLADTNSDNVVNITDATRIQKHIAGMIEIVEPTEKPTEDKPIELPFVPAK